MSFILADPVAFIVAVVVAVLFLAIILFDLWTAAGKPADNRRCSRCRSRHHTDCNDGDNR